MGAFATSPPSRAGRDGCTSRSSSTPTTANPGVAQRPLPGSQLVLDALEQAVRTRNLCAITDPTGLMHTGRQLDLFHARHGPCCGSSVVAAGGGLDRSGAAGAGQGCTSEELPTRPRQRTRSAHQSFTVMRGAVPPRCLGGSVARVTRSGSRGRLPRRCGSGEVGRLGGRGLRRLSRRRLPVC